MKIKEFLSKQIYEVKKIRYPLLALFSIITFSYSIFFIDKGLFSKMNIEDGLNEYLTALLLLSTSVVFIIIFSRTKKIINLLFCLVFLFGFGEEISWGQRIFNYNVPDTVTFQNRQGEFNLHNMEFSTPSDISGKPKPIYMRYLNFGALFLLFCMVYTIIYPILWDQFIFVRKFGQTLGLQLPPIIFGVFFLLNYLIRKILIVFWSGNHYRIEECDEFILILIFFMMSLSFLKNVKYQREVR